jgi:hypothetical protein
MKPSPHINAKHACASVPTSASGGLRLLASQVWRTTPSTTAIEDRHRRADEAVDLRAHGRAARRAADADRAREAGRDDRNLAHVELGIRRPKK